MSGEIVKVPGELSGSPDRPSDYDVRIAVENGLSVMTRGSFYYHARSSES